MYKLCKTEQSAARQRQLEEGLLLTMAAMRYEDITVSDLCERIGVPRKTFYRYFDSKDGALHALLDHTLMQYEGFNAVYLSGEARTLQRELEQFFQFWVLHKDLLDALDKSDISGMLIAFGYGDAQTLFAQGQSGDAEAYHHVRRLRFNVHGADLAS